MKMLGATILAAAGLASIACGPPDPESLYVELGCPRCHGFELQGNRYGPALHRLGENWDSEARMAAYLKDPKTVIESDPRLKAQDAGYELKMQPVTTASDEEISILATWLVKAE